MLTSMSSGLAPGTATFTTSASPDETEAILRACGPDTVLCDKAGRVLTGAEPFLDDLLGVRRSGGPPTARDLLPEAADVFTGLAAEHGGQIPATEFLVHDVEPYDVLQAITNRFELRMRARGTRDLPIRIVTQSEGPEQPLV